jgi:hypothetical protein
VPVDRDLIAGAALFACAALYLAGSLGLPGATDSAEPGPAFFPRLIGVVLIGLALAILVNGVLRSVRKMGEAAAREAARASRSRAIAFHPLVLVGLTFVYALAFERAGALPSTLAYTFAATVLFHPRRGWHWLIVPVFSVAFVYGLFVRGLGLILPGLE